MPIDSSTLERLQQIVGADHVLWRPGDVEPYAHDATPLHHARPDAVVRAATTAEVAAVLLLATTNGIPVIPRGAGSNLAAATLAERGGIVLSLTRMNRIKEVSKAELLAVVEPGVTNAALGQSAANEGLLYPPDPGSRIVSTVGGNVATCAGGLRGLKYGVTRNYVLGLEVVLPTGEVIRTGGRLWKDVAGYDITRLLTGSEGTLGVITEVTVGLPPSPATSRTGVAYFDTLAAAGDAVADIIAGGILPATLEFLDRRCINAVEDYARIGLDREAGARSCCMATTVPSSQLTRPWNAWPRRVRTPALAGSNWPPMSPPRRTCSPRAGAACRHCPGLRRSPCSKTSPCRGRGLPKWWRRSRRSPCATASSARHSVMPATATFIPRSFSMPTTVWRGPAPSARSTRSSGLRCGWTAPSPENTASVPPNDPGWNNGSAPTIWR